MIGGGWSLDSGLCLKFQLNLHQGLATPRENWERPKEMGCPEQVCRAALVVPPGNLEGSFDPIGVTDSFVDQQTLQEKARLSGELQRPDKPQICSMIPRWGTPVWMGTWCTYLPLPAFPTDVGPSNCKQCCVVKRLMAPGPQGDPAMVTYH